MLLGLIAKCKVDPVMEDPGINPDGFTPDEINLCNGMRDKYGFPLAFSIYAFVRSSGVQIGTLLLCVVS